MRCIYDYDSNRLQFTTKKNIFFDLQLRKNIVFITGCSATGKTFFVNALSAFKKTVLKSDDVDLSNIEIINDASKVADGKILYIIDRGDVVLNRDFCRKIVNCTKARFLIFARGTYPVGVSPNQFGEFVRDGNKIMIYYEFNESCIKCFCR